ncbi:CHASE3 domain-containing protein [Pacificimonas sp. WHA3]|uniref:histidine kinase n=1 Tax=Pacificimonas pallii TaxID=2827236 RepID=A0ABS6SED8_9SPHN|nr:CHASE3 domain-containing protein [Pacificimonas pallii]MBV7256754.1 CHASE3 domain-containing protein [Pacificimonas pallii]
MAGERERRGTERLWVWALVLGILAAALVGIALLAAAGYRQTIGDDSARMRAADLYAESYQTIMAAEGVYNALQDAERGQRGYALTQNPEFLEPYRDNVSLVAPRLAELDDLAAKSETQAARVMVLRRISDLKVQEMAEVVKMIEAGQQSRAEREIASGYGRRLMIDIRDIMTELREEEQLQLAERGTAVQKSERELASSIAELAKLGLALLIVAFLALIGVAALLIRARRALRRELVVEEENEALEEAVVARTRELVDANERLIAEAQSRESAENRLRQAQRMEAVGQLTGGIAHDFNNMLAVVIGSLDLLRRRTKDQPKLHKLIDNAHEGADRAATLTARLLAFSRQQSLKPEAIDPNALVLGMEEFLTRTLTETVHIEIDLHEDTPHVFADAAELENVLINLAANARDAMPKGGVLTVSTEKYVLEREKISFGQSLQAGTYAKISVADTGEGMPPDVLAKVYEPFFTTKPVGKGTGLGLSQVQGFVLQSGGSIEIFSKPGEGSRIDLLLPEGKAVTGADAGYAQPDMEQELPEARESETILVVEDEAQLRALTVDVLRDLGYVVRHASSASEALTALEEQPVAALLFTDIVMPDLSGEELARTALAKIPELKLLYTSGYTQAAGVDAARLNPPAELLRKPYQVDALARAVRRALDG